SRGRDHAIARAALGAGARDRRNAAARARTQEPDRPAGKPHSVQRGAHPRDRRAKRQGVERYFPGRGAAPGGGSGIGGAGGAVDGVAIVARSAPAESAIEAAGVADNRGGFEATAGDTAPGAGGSLRAGAATHTRAQ